MSVGLFAVPGSTEPVMVPDTLSAAHPVSSAPVEPEFPIDFVAVVWTGSEEGHEGAAVRLRHGGAWGKWQALEEDGAQAHGQFGSALVAARDADAYQVRGIPPGAAHAKGVALNTTDGPLVEAGRRPRGAAQAASPCRSRADWGADESMMTWSPTYHEVQVVTVHHTATTNGDNDSAATVRAIYRYHAVDRGWGDIGYQYLVDQAGVVYEGRYSGPSSSCVTSGGTGADFAHDDAGKGVTAAHVSGMNSGNVGVALLGNYATVLPPLAQRSALEDQLAGLANRHGIDPVQPDFRYVNPVSGASKAVPTISGHRDWLATECPGGELYAQLPSIRSNVEAAMGSSATTTTTTTTTSTTTSVVSNPLELNVTSYKVKGVQHADLSWRGAATATVDVLRDGVAVAAGTPNDGAHTDRMAKGKGDYTYRVCESGTSTCSRDVKVSFS